VSIIRTFAAFSFTILSAIILLIAGIPAFIVSVLGLKKPMSWVMYRLGQSWAYGVVAITGCTMIIEGRENIPRSGGVCFVSNHVGTFDIMLMLAYIGRPFGFIAKKELMFAPFFNMWIAMLGGLFIDRKNPRKALKTISAGVKKIQRGGCMLIFPEGTRSKGRGLLPFKSGAIKLATNSLAPIVPIAISGSYDVFEKEHRIRPTTVRVIFCPPVITAEMSPEDRRRNLVDKVHGIIEAALQNRSGIK
jgi:1-acyl-sn-glycerol-3-phosphate acyltransferase